MTDSTLLRAALQRIRIAAGLAPVVWALGACDDPSEARSFGDGSADVDTDVERADAGEAAPPADPEVPVGSATAVGELAMDVLGVVAPGHVTEYRFRNLPVGGTVTLRVGGAGGDQPGALSEPQLVGRVSVTQPTEEVRAIVPADLFDRLGAQPLLGFEWTVVLEGVELHREVVIIAPEAIPPDYPGIQELHPGLDPDALEVGDRRRACVPEARYGSLCTAAEDFHPWQGLEVVAYALDAPLPVDRTVSACFDETAFEGSCCYVFDLFDPADGPSDETCEERANNGPPNWTEGGGRPFVTGQVSVQAPLQLVDGWGSITPVPSVPGDRREALAAAWSATALAEHASVASFARLTLELLSLGAPAHLVAASTQAQLDEVRHAQLAFGVASALAGEPIGPGAIDISGALEGRDVATILTAAIVEGCICETIASVQVRVAASRATDPEMAALLRGIADDEMRHAELSWAVVRWLLEQHPELLPVARGAFEGFDPGPSAKPEGVDLSDGGQLSEAERHLVALQVLEEVVNPAAAGLWMALDWAA